MSRFALATHAKPNVKRSAVPSQPGNKKTATPGKKPTTKKTSKSFKILGF